MSDTFVNLQMEAGESQNWFDSLLLPRLFEISLASFCATGGDFVIDNNCSGDEVIPLQKASSPSTASTKACWM